MLLFSVLHGAVPGYISLPVFVAMLVALVLKVALPVLVVMGVVGRPRPVRPLLAALFVGAVCLYGVGFVADSLQVQLSGRALLVRGSLLMILVAGFVSVGLHLLMIVRRNRVHA